jgi:hypothetical protein
VEPAQVPKDGVIHDECTDLKADQDGKGKYPVDPTRASLERMRNVLLHGISETSSIAILSGLFSIAYKH